jgi:hypothetical protein
MAASRSLPQVALVIKWPAAVTSEIVIRQVIRRLLDARLPATWSVEDAAQAESLQWWGATRFGGDAALLIDADAMFSARGQQALEWTRRLTNRLMQLRSVGIGAEALHAGGTVAKSLNPQYLGSAGIRAIVADLAGPAVRALPLGMWQFAPRVALPVAERWWQLLRRRMPVVPAHPGGSPAVASIDLARLASMRPRAWQACDAELAAVAHARSHGAITVSTVAEIAAALAVAHAVKPQRSILRAA